MAKIENGVVSAVSSKMKTIRGRPASEWFLVVDGKQYVVGLKKPPVEAGDVVSFESAFNYGAEQVNMATFSTGFKGAVGGTTTPAKGGSSPKPFPVPYDHGDRSIIRQNALTNARELFTNVPNMCLLEGKDVTIENVTRTIIHIASQFEKYSAGDYEKEAAEKLMSGV